MTRAGRPGAPASAALVGAAAGELPNGVRSPVLDAVIEAAATGALYDEMVDTRRDLHANPELSMLEHRTTSIIRRRLVSLGATVVRTPTQTGAVSIIDGDRPGRTVVLRADIDALPVHEAADVPYHSRDEGVMHACGHDVHAAALLGVARVLADRAPELAGRYVLVFQPAEEALCGARAMVDGGLLDTVGAAALVGCHVTSALPTGVVGLRAGIAMAAVHSVRLTVRGEGGHGAVPTRRGDVVTASAALVSQLSGVVEGLAYEGTGCVCSAGVVRAGTARNVVPDRAVIEGTLRTFTDEQRIDAVGRLTELGRQVGDRFGVEVDLALPEYVPPVHNDPAATAVVAEVARRAVGDSGVIEMPPVAPSDDVSIFLERVQGCYFMVGGARADGTSGMHHSPRFALDEESLRVAARTMAGAAVALAELPDPDVPAGTAGPDPEEPPP